MKSLLSTLSSVFGDAFEKLGLDRSYGETVISQRPDLGQFQCNGALAAAKQAKKNPREIATAVLEALDNREIFSDLSLAGPGFINASLTDRYLAERMNALIEDERAGCPPTDHPKRVVIDFGGPNVAKAMHVGHLRSSIIGDSLRRLLAFLGDNVAGDVHLGDWGTQMGMLITEVERRQPELPYFDADFSGPYPEESPVTIEDLERLYPEASARCREDEAAMTEARTATAELQAGRPGYVALWRHFVDVSTEALKRDFGDLGVHFDLWLGESDAQPRIPGMVEELKQREIAVESQGALVIHVPPGPDERELPPLILVKSDGGVMYGTTDLATILNRVEQMGAEEILYVVDARQAQHFEQVFRAARIAGVPENLVLEHIPFGTVNGPDGRPFKTRAGGTMKLGDLLTMAREQARRRMDEAGVAVDYDEAEKEAIARMVGIAAVKFADLSTYRTSGYLFDLEKFTEFEGRTGAYLLYAAVRIKSILRNAAERGYYPGAILPPDGNQVERDLMLSLTALPEVLETARRNRAPNYICEYVYNLAQSFSRFYAHCHILGEEDEARRASWLRLSQLCLRMFELTLGLLGIEVPERM